VAFEKRHLRLNKCHRGGNEKGNYVLDKIGETRRRVTAPPEGQNFWVRVKTHTQNRARPTECPEGLGEIHDALAFA
jgi:hypothetical protein